MFAQHLLHAGLGGNGHKLEGCLRKGWEAQVHGLMGLVGHERSIRCDPSQDHLLFPAPNPEPGIR